MRDYVLARSSTSMWYAIRLHFSKTLYVISRPAAIIAVLDRKESVFSALNRIYSRHTATQIVHPHQHRLSHITDLIADWIEEVIDPIQTCKMANNVAKTSSRQDAPLMA